MKINYTLKNKPSMLSVARLGRKKALNVRRVLKETVKRKLGRSN